MQAPLTAVADEAGVGIVLEGCRAHGDVPALPLPLPVRDLREAMVRAARRRTGLR